jgi:hypothetical protein
MSFFWMIALVMEVVSASETSVNFYGTTSQKTVISFLAAVKT